MIFNLSSLSSEKSHSKDISFEVNFNDKHNDLFVSQQPIKFKGTIKKSNEFFYLEGLISGQLTMRCARCLEKITYNLNLETNEKLSTLENFDDDSTIFIDDETIDLEELIENNIIFSLPQQLLCSEDCKGLCPKCGAVLNKDECNCDITIIDPRLEKLKDLFSNTEEV